MVYILAGTECGEVLNEFIIKNTGSYAADQSNDANGT